MDHINLAITRQIKSAFGAFNQFHISLYGLDHIIRDIYITKEEFIALEDSNNTIKRVSYRYLGKAVVAKAHHDVQALKVTLLADDYTRHPTSLMENCSSRDFIFENAEDFWYYYRPEKDTCQRLIEHELMAIKNAADQSKQNSLSSVEAQRRFISVTAHLLNNLPEITQQSEPNYGALFKLENRSSKVIFYILSSAELDSEYPYDRFGLEHIKCLHHLLSTHAPLDLRAFEYYQEKFRIILDQKNQEHQTLVKTMREIAEKWIVWDIPVIIDTQEIIVQIRSFYGNDMFSHESRNLSKLRFKEAFKDGDVVIYNGHSYLGHGSLNSANYISDDFDTKYQVIFLNSCYSFSYYGQGFFDLMPKTKNRLDLMLNGSASLIENSGLINAAFITNLFKRKSYHDILVNMHNSAAPELRLIERSFY